MIKKTLATLSFLVVVLGGVAFIFFGMIHTLVAAMANQGMPPAPVTTQVIKTTSWQPTLTSVGSLTAVQGVTVSAQLDGTVTGLHFQAGSKVKAGDLLVQMDIGPEQAQLRAAEASLHLAQVNLRRSRELLQRNTISQAQLDTDAASEQQMQAQADNIRATIAKKTIRAPFTGRLGVRLVDLGQTLKAGDAIVSLQALDPIYADFYLPQQQLSQLSSDLPVNVTCDAFPGETFAGKVTAINPEIDPATRNLRVQATLANAKEQLRPGMFVSVNVVLPHAEQVLAIPQTAILYAPFGNSVYVVVDSKDPKTGASTKVAKQAFVRLGRKQGDFVAVTSGLKEGDEVITTGVFKLFPGEPVMANNSLAPDAQLNPTPSDS